LRGGPLSPERLHVTLHHIDDYAGLPPQVVAAVRDAAVTVRMEPFEVEFDRVASSPAGRATGLSSCAAETGSPN